MNNRIIYETDNMEYRILEIQETDFDFDNLCGDTFNPKVNPDIAPETLAQQLDAFADEVNSEGVYGYVLERWNPKAGVGWEHVDSCFGFVGQYSTGRFNHYIVDELKGQIE